MYYMYVCTDAIYHGQCNGPMRVHVALGAVLRARRLGVCFERQLDYWNGVS